jgi:hypothetical protein
METILSLSLIIILFIYFIKESIDYKNNINNKSELNKKNSIEQTFIFVLKIIFVIVLTQIITNSNLKLSSLITNRVYEIIYYLLIFCIFIFLIINNILY